MDLESDKRIESPDTQRLKPKPAYVALTVRDFIADSPLVPKKTRERKKAKPLAKTEAPFYEIKNILAEEWRKGTLFYKIDWEGTDPETRNPWDPSWEPACNASPGAIEDWNRKKKRKSQEAQAEGHNEALTELPSSDVRPVHSNKRKRQSSLSGPQQNAKKPRPIPISTASSAEKRPFQSVSQELPGFQDAPLEIKDSYEEPQLSASSSRATSKISVENPAVPKDFNKTAYLDPQLPSRDQSSLESTSSQPPIKPRPGVNAPQRPRPIFFEDDIEGILPDSQDLSSSSLFLNTIVPPEVESSINKQLDFESASPSNTRSSREEERLFSSNFPGPSSYRPSASVPNPESAEPDQSARKSLEERSQDREKVESPKSKPSETQSVSLEEGTGTLNPSERESVDLRQPTQKSLDDKSPHTSTLFLSNNEGYSATGICESIIESRSPHTSSRDRVQQALEKSQQNQSLGTELQQRRPSPHTSLSTPTTQIRTQSPSPTQSTALPRAATQSIIPSASIASIPDEPLILTPKPNSFFRVSTPAIPQSQPSPTASDFQSNEREMNVTSPRTPVTNSNMEDSLSMSGSKDTKQIIKEARARASAKSAAKREASRSVSTIPATPLAPPRPSEMLPLRETFTENAVATSPDSIPKLVPALIPNSVPATASALDPTLAVEPSSPTKLSPKPESDSSPKNLQIFPLGPNEYIIPIPLVSLTRDIYVQTVRNYKRQRLAFLKDNTEVNVVAEIDTMIEELEKLCDHQDLIADSYSTQRDEPLLNQARYAENISTKCIFLAEFINDLRIYNRHVVILSRPGRMQEILESLLHNYSFVKRPGKPHQFFDISGGPMRLSLLPTDGIEGHISDEPISVIIALSSGSARYWKSFKASSTPSAPLISPVVVSSIEHLDLCFTAKLKCTERRVALVKCLSQLQEDIGKLDSDNYPPPPDAAKAAVSFVVDETDVWPVPAMPDIYGVEFESLSTPQPNDTSQTSASTTQSYNTMPPPHLQAQPQPQSAIQSSAKRQLSLDSTAGSDSLKRQRLTPTPIDQVIDISHISETLTSDAADKEAISQTREDQASELCKQLNVFKDNIHSHETTKAELLERNQNLDARCKDLESSISIIQPKYQKALNDQGHFEYQYAESLRREDALKIKYDAELTESKKLRDEKKVADEALKAARVSLLGSAVPGIAELQRMRDDVRTVKTENEGLKRRIMILENRDGYLNNQYQSASQEIVATVHQNKALQEEVSKLRIKAGENSVRIHEIHNKSEVQQHLDRIKALTTENEELVRELERKSEDLKTIKNGRRPTRGTSVPRSPRLGTGTISPKVGRVIGNIANGSRGNSPAPGEIPMRGQFSDALFQGPQARWGNHLQ